MLLLSTTTTTPSLTTTFRLILFFLQLLRQFHVRLELGGFFGRAGRLQIYRTDDLAVGTEHHGGLGRDLHPVLTRRALDLECRAVGNGLLCRGRTDGSATDSTNGGGKGALFKGVGSRLGGTSLVLFNGGHDFGLFFNESAFFSVRQAFEAQNGLNGVVVFRGRRLYGCRERRGGSLGGS